MTDRPIPPIGSDEFAEFARDPLGWQRGKPVTDLSEDLEKWGRSMHNVFTAMVKGGFTEAQALEIIGRGFAETMTALVLHQPEGDDS